MAARRHRSDQINHSELCHPAALLVVALAVAALALWASAVPLARPEATQDTAPSAIGAAPTLPGQVPNLADPATPIPTDLPDGAPARLVVDNLTAAAFASFNPDVSVALASEGFAVVEAPATSLALAVQRLRAFGAESIELDVEVALHNQVIPTDPLWSQWWGARQVGLPSAWGATLGADQTVVAIIDTGVTTVPELAGRVLPGRSYIGAGYSANTDWDGHGTSAAVVAAGAINNGVAAGGACPACVVLPVQVVRADTRTAYLSDVAAGIEWAANNGADVISVSLGGPSTITALSNAVNLAESRRVPVVASAGNNGDQVLNYPAAHPLVIAVAGLAQNGQLESWSTRGSWVETAAAGCNITQRHTDNVALNYCGTSSAAPLVAGSVALLDTRFPDGTVAQIRQRVQESSVAGVNTAWGSLRADTMVTNPVPLGATVAQAPTVISATGADRSVTVAFAPPSGDGGTPVTGYQYSTDSGASWRALAASPATITTTSTGITLTNGTPVTLTIRAVNLVGPSAPTNPVTATPRTTPGQPTNLTATVVTTGPDVRVTWTPPANDGGTPITSYTVEWSTNPTFATTVATASVDSQTTTNGLTGAVPGTTYHVRVGAVNAAGSGVRATTSVLAATIPAVPSLESVSIGNASLTVAFAPPSGDGGTPVTGYQYSTDSGASWRALAASPATITTTSTGITLTNGTPVTLTIRAVNLVGPSAPTNPVTATPRTTPGQPTNLTATVVTTGPDVQVTWTPPANDGGTPITSYTVEWSTNPTFIPAVTATRPATTDTTIGGLPDGTEIHLRVRAVNAAGAGPWSSPATIRTPDAVAPPEPDAIDPAPDDPAPDDPAPDDPVPDDPATENPVTGDDEPQDPADDGPEPGDTTTVAAPFAVSPFTDVPVGSFFDLAVRWAYALGVTTGTSKGFAPTDSITRGQLVAMLWRTAGQPEPPAEIMPLDDVSPAAYYFAAARWAYATAVTTGTSPTTFSPDNTVTRAQAVTMLWRMAGQPAPVGPNPFSDVPAGTYFDDATAWAYQQGITTGIDGSDRFAPSQLLNRAQLVTLLWRAAGSPTGPASR